MRKLSRREKGLLGLLAVAAVALSAWALRHSDAAPAVLGRPRAERPLLPVPRIDLARIDGHRAESEAGRRDLFAFGTAAAPEEDLAAAARRRDDARRPGPRGRPRACPGARSRAAPSPRACRP